MKEKDLATHTHTHIQTQNTKPTEKETMNIYSFQCVYKSLLLLNVSCCNCKLYAEKKI